MKAGNIISLELSTNLLYNELPFVPLLQGSYSEGSSGAVQWLHPWFMSLTPHTKWNGKRKREQHFLKVRMPLGLLLGNCGCIPALPLLGPGFYLPLTVWVSHCAQSSSCVWRYTVFFVHLTLKCLLLCWILNYFPNLMRKSMLISNKCLAKGWSVVILSICMPCPEHLH